MGNTKTIHKKAYAKLNLFLNVSGKRADGYHDLEMLNVRIDLFDDLKLTFGGTEKVTILSNDRFLENRNNLLYKIAVTLLEEEKEERPIIIEVQKRIPSGAGLGGNSADAAMIIEGLNELCEWNYSKKELQAIGLRFGADIPYCFEKSPAIVEGLGEKITPVPLDFSQYRIVLKKPDAFISTEAIFRKGDEIGFPHFDSLPIRKAIAEGNIEKIIDEMQNSLEEITLGISPETKNVYQEMVSLYGVRGVRMTGSGSTVFKILTASNLLILENKCVKRDRKSEKIHCIL